MKTIFTIVLLLSVGLAKADDSLLSFDAVYRAVEQAAAISESDDVKGYDVHRVYVFLYIKNISNKTVKVATRCRSNAAYANRRIAFDMKIIPEANPLRLNTVVADSDFSIVTLQPGEITVIKAEDFAKKEPTNGVMVGYTVDTTMAERYGFWAGSVQLEARYVRM